MSYILCINSIKDISDLSQNKTNTINLSFVDQTVCKDPDNKLLQLVLYITFYTFDSSEGRIKFVQYHHAITDNKNYLFFKSNIGIGGYIDQLTDIKVSQTTIAKDGTKHFIMTKQDLVDTISNTIKRNFIENLGIDILDTFKIPIELKNFIFFMDGTTKEANQVHLCLSATIELTNEQYNKFFEIIRFNSTKFNKVDSISIDIQYIIERLNATSSITNSINKFNKEYNYKDWSHFLLDLIIRNRIVRLFKNLRSNK